MLQGKTAIVTGSTSGIGLGIAQALAARGADIMLNGFGDAKEIDALRAELAAGHGVRVSYSGADMSRPAEIVAMVEQATAELGRVDILVNNAGTIGRADLEGTDDAIWDRDTSVIMKGTYLCTQAVYSQMKTQGGGKVVNIASVSGKIGGAVSKVGDSPEAMQGRSGPAYAAAKGGVIAFTKWVAKDGGRYGIYVNAVCPGPVSSEMTRGFDYGVENQPIARMGEPEDIAEAVVFLASNAANYITGQALNVDGGLVMD